MTRTNDRPRKGGSFIRTEDGKLKPAPRQMPTDKPAPGKGDGATKTAKEG